MAVQENNINLLQDIPRPVIAWRGTYKVGDAVDSHCHPRGQLLYAISGVMRIHTAERVWVVPPQRALWIPAGVWHSHTSLTDVEMRTLYISTTAVAPLDPLCYVLTVSALLKELILALLREPLEYPLPGRGEHLVALILSEIIQAPRLHIDIPWPLDRRLQQACQRLLEQPGSASSIEHLADQAGASTRTLIRLFQKETGMRYRQWLQQVQLADALVRLDRGEPINRIASALGYRSAAAFSAMFRKHLGCAPQQYRKGA